MNDPSRKNLPRTDPPETPVDEHLSWIDAACREFEAMGGPVSSKLESHESNVSPDDRIAASLSRALPGYTIKGECERGGQGVVFRAVQKATDRHVAIKVLHETSVGKTRDRSRFEREVKILGQLRHANIVKILDTGSTEGRFFYIMDFIEGMPLDDYVLKNNVSIHDALVLFQKVCNAVNVAHLRGIIHRDIKPSNIRVDHSGEPHVMDFGLAKVDEFDAIADSRTEAQTVSGQFVGTLPWASPEQLDGLSDDLDIRTDVYSLGIVLYQILARSFPYEVCGSMRKTLENICQIDPQKPSTINPNIDDEVDCIVLKALRKRREHRYQSAGNLAREINRYLAGEPIEAKRENNWYVLRKTVRRNRGKAIIAGLVIVLIVHSLIAMTMLFRQESRLRADAENARDEAQEARDEAEHQKAVALEVNAFLNHGVLASARPDMLGKDVTVREALDSASADIEEYFPNEPELQGRVRFVVGNTYYELGVVEEARQNLQLALKQLRETLGAEHPDTLHALNDLARIYEGTGEYIAARDLIKECHETRKRVLGEFHPDTIISLSNLGWMYVRLGENQTAEQLSRMAVSNWDQATDVDESQRLLAVNNLASILMERDKYTEAEPLLVEVHEWYRTELGETHPTTLVAMSNLATLYKHVGQPEKAETYYLQVLNARKKILGLGHPQTLICANNLAVLYSHTGRDRLAEKLLLESIGRGRATLAEDNPNIVALMSNLGKAIYAQDRYEEALTKFDNALVLAQTIYPENHPNVALYMARKGAALGKLNQDEEAMQLFDEAYTLLVDSVGPNDPRTTSVVEHAMEFYSDRNLNPQVQTWKDRHREQLDP